jgi:hypothetical protein
MPRSLVHLLLSLLLLVSQQLSLGHGYTHWSEFRETLAQSLEDGQRDGKPLKPGLHDLCGQCAASAQVAFALPPTAGICLLTECVFQPRGPPRA